MAAMPLLRPLVLASALLGAALTVSAGNAESTDAGLPPDAELEAAHAHIGKIEVRTLQIFDLGDPADNYWLFRTADHLHQRTRNSVILAQLLFRSGDPYSRRILDESARNIRLNSSFLREPVIHPIRYHDGLVDIEVITHDVWTFEPGVNFSRSGGANTTGVDIADANFFGFGKYIEIGHGQNVDRSSNFLRWQDPNVWGSHWTDGAVYSNNSDGTVWQLVGGLPFYSLESHAAAGVDLLDNHSIVTRYRLGRTYDGYDVNDHAGDLFVGRAIVVTDAWTERMLLGWRVDNDNFSAPPGQTPLAALPQDRDLSYPFVRMQWVENRFDTMRNLDLIARTEDVHFGLDASIGLGLATPALGADRHSVLADTEINYGWRFSETEEMFLTSRLASRFEDGGLRDAMITWGAAYYLQTSEMTRMLVRFTGDAGHDLDGDHTVQLGGDTGLRGYPLRYQNGNQRALFTLEERLYTNWYLFRLFNVGA
ncbi:MAG TPA: hypothetical protein VNZ06_02815, partial [Steroidobacteraceae bacterium]|nr:hypothetical protein [Steroidobacteraceae bacterium]